MLRGGLLNSTTKFWLVRAIAPFVVFTITLCAGFAYTASRPKQYEASARIWVQVRGIPLQLSADSGGPGFLTSPLTSGTNPLSTACEVLRSQAVVEEAVQKLSEKMPGKQCPAAWEIQAGIVAQAVKDADVIRVSYKDSNDEVALAVVEAIVSAFLEENCHQTAGNATQSKVYLKKQLADAQAAYAHSSQVLKQFKETGESVDLESQTTSLLDQRADLDKQLLDMQQASESGAAKMAYLEQQLGISSDDVMKADTVGQDEVVQGLRASIADYEVKLIDLKTKYQEAHPKMKRLRASLAEAKRSLINRLMELSGKSDAKAATNMVTTGSDVQGKLLEEMAEIKAEQVTNKQLTKTIHSLMGSLDGRLKSIPSKQARLTELVRANDMAMESLSSVEKQLQNLDLTESVAMGTSNLQVIDAPAVVDTTATDQKIAVILALILSGLTAGIQFMLDTRVRNGKQIGNILPLPIEAWIPTLKPGTTIRDVLSPLQRLRATIKLWIKEGRKLVIITSPDNGDGKSTVAYGLALSLAESGQRVMLIDANLSHPSLHILCKQQGSPGVIDYLNNPTDEQAHSSVHPVMKNLLLIPAGQIAPDESVLTAPAFHDLISRFEPKIDVFLVDTKAIGESLHSLAVVDTDIAVVALVRLGHTRRRSTKLLAAQIAMNPRCEAVAVVNDVHDQVIASSVVAPAAPVQAPQPETPELQESATANW